LEGGNPKGCKTSAGDKLVVSRESPAVVVVIGPVVVTVGGPGGGDGAVTKDDGAVVDGRAEGGTEDETGGEAVNAAFGTDDALYDSDGMFVVANAKAPAGKAFDAPGDEALETGGVEDDT
jgi:hypothetical protein